MENAIIWGDAYVVGLKYEKS